MARLPDASALGQTQLRAPSGIAGYTPTTGMEGAQADALQSVAKDAFSTAEVFKQEAVKQDTLRAEDAYTKLSQARLDLTYGDNGFTKLRGADAVTKPILNEYSDQLKAKVAEISAGLGNDDQRQLFQKRANLAGVQYQQDILQHLSQQNDVYRKQVLDTSIKTAQQDAAANPSNVPANLVRLSALVDQQPGLTDETKTAAKLEIASGMHVAVLNEMMSLNKSQDARRYFAENQAQIDPTKWDTIRKTLDQISVKNDSLTLSLSLKSVGGLSNQIKTLNQQFQDGKISADLVDATRTRLEHDYQLAKAQQAEGEKNLMGAAQDWLLKNPTATVTDLPPSLYNGLKNTGHLDSIAGFARSGRFDNDPKAWLDFTSTPRSQLATMTTDELYAKYRGKFDDAHLERAGAMLQSAQDPDNAKHANVVTVNEVVKRSAQDAGIIPWNGKSNDSQSKAYGAYETEVDRQTKAYEQSVLGGKRAANADEVKKITDNILMNKVFVNNTFFDSQKPMFQLTPQEMKDAYVKTPVGEIKVSAVPVQQRMDIINELRKRNRPISEQAIVDLWVRAGRPK